MVSLLWQISKYFGFFTRTSFESHLGLRCPIDQNPSHQNPNRDRYFFPKFFWELLLSEFRSDRDLAYASSFSASVFPPEKIIKVMSVHVQGGRKPDYLTLLMVNWNASALQNNCSRFEHGNIFIVRQMILTGDVIMFFRTLLLTKLINLRLFILERPIRARKFCDIVCWEKSGKFKF